MPATTATPTTSNQRLPRPDGAIAFDVAGDGPLVVCIPGMADLRTTWRHLTPALLAAGARVATLDLRGHGDSDAGFAEHGDEPTADDVAALIEHLGGPAVVIGNSMGAAAAVLVAARRPELVRGVVLVGPFVRELPVPLAKRLLMRALLVRPWGPRALVAWLRTLMPAHRPADADAHLAAIRASLDLPGHWAAFRATAFAGHRASGDALADVRCPALVVMGERDPDFPDPAAEAGAVAEAVGGEVVLVPEAGHYPHAERPELVAAAVVPFLAGLADA